MFENDVKMYGTQAMIWPAGPLSMFENDVKMYGTSSNTIILNDENNGLEWCKSV